MAEGCQYLYKDKWYSEDELRTVFAQRGKVSRNMVFLRHGVTSEDDEGKNSGQNNVSITPEGTKETKEALERDLRAENVEVVYTSPTRRAMQTSQIISKDLNIPIIEVKGLAAWDLGKFSSRPEGEFDEKYYVNNPDVKVPGGESFNQFKNRLLAAVDQIQHSAKKPAILSHSKSLKIIEALHKTGGVWNQQAIDEYFSEGDPDNKQVNKFDYFSSDEPVKKNINPSQASAATMKKVKEFLDRIGVEVQSLAKITYNGKSLGVNGLADPLNGLIQVVQGKEDLVLPEEAMHIAVELVEQKDPKLFKEMMDRIGRYNLTDQVFAEYQNNPFYQTKEGKPDVNKIKKEAIGKVLAQTVIDMNRDATENPTLLDQVRNWWKKIVDFLKGLFSKAEFNPFEEVAQSVLKGKDLGKVQDLSGTPFASRNPNAVNASLKLVSALRDPRAAKWFSSLNRVTFLQKLQTDLQAPKAQVDMLIRWMKGKEFDSIGDIITGIMSELSYTVEINTAMDYRWEDNYIFDEGEEPTLDNSIKKIESPSQHYSNLTVPGGANYRENEIKTPDITPSIKGHAQFATDQGIGWFRSDDKREATSNTLVTSDPRIKQLNSYGIDKVELDGNTYHKDSNGQWWKGGDIDKTKIRRVLEIQSDLFQKGRNTQSLSTLPLGFNKETLDKETELLDKFQKAEVGDLLAENKASGMPTKIFKNSNTEIRVEQEGLRHTENIIPISDLSVNSQSYEEYLSKNDFLQLLNKENNWVTFFVKSIIQDSAKKDYEKIRFPGGDTAAKIEGHQTLKEYIEGRKRMIESSKEQLREVEGLMETMKEQGHLEQLSTFEDKRESIRRELSQFEKELSQAEGPNGEASFSPIRKFYGETVYNVLKKQGYNPQEVTDEYGNKWFEVNLNSSHLGEFYFQVSGPQDLAEKLMTKNANITKKGDEFEINGNKIRNSIQKDIRDFLKKRIGAQQADKALRGFKQETENKVQVDIQDILNRYIDSDNKLRDTPLTQSNPSAVDPSDNSFYLTLESHLAERLGTYEPGTQFIHSINLFDGINTAGHADLIAITPQGQVDILQFKVPQLSGVANDIPVYRQEAYNLEIEGLRKILQTGYKVNRSDFRQTRAIPIKAEYERVAPGISDQKLSKLTIGNTNVSLIRDDLLLPIASESEVSANEKFDKFITRLRALAQKLGAERVSPDKREERSKRVAELVGAIRKLQIKKDGSGIVASAKAIIKRSKERGVSLKDKISNTDPNVATILELNKIADEILSDKDQVEIYKDLYNVYKNIFNDGTVDSQDIIKEAREVSDDANDLIEDYWDMAVQFRTKKFAAKVGIKDEFTPEKKLTWYRRMIRSLSQSSIKAGAELWELVKRINNGHKLEFLDRLDKLGKIEKAVSEWLKGKPVQELYRKIFKYDSKGRWTGKIIQKIDRKFYEDLKKAQENRDMKWVHDNIDVDAYRAWFVADHQRRIDYARTERIVADDTENARLVQQKLQDFVDTFHIDFRKGVGTYNWALQNFPKEGKWKSAEYQELERNKPLLDLYNYYTERLKESWDLGMLHEHNGWSWFPNVRRNLLEKLSSAPAGGKVASLFGNLRIEAEDQTFGKIDPITGKPLDEIHANFVSDLGQWVKDADDNYFLDYSEKSMDIFKVIALWDSEIIKYKLKTESEGLARLLYYTEADPRRQAYDTGPTGKLKREKGTNRPLPISNEVNAAYIKEFLDAVYYGKAKANEFDVAINIPYKSAVERINKLFGHEVISVPEQEEIKISGVKAIEAMNRYFVTKTLGVNVMTAAAQMFGGSINTAINQGLYFNKKDMLEAELKYVSGKFWANPEDKKLAGLISYLHPFLEDKTGHEIRKMSVSKAVEYLSSDQLFFMQRGADAWVNSIIALSMIKNTMISDGKLVNIRDFARKELGHANKYQGTYEEAKAFDERFEKRVEELQKSPQALVNYAQVVDDHIVLPGIERSSDAVINMRQQMLEVIKDALGNTSIEDLSLYKRNIMWQSFFMFKNWIPRMADVRFKSLEYSPGTQKYEYGRVRMLWNAVFSKNRAGITNLLKMLGNNDEPLVEVAKREYAKKRESFAEELQDLDMTEAEFVDMYIKGVRSELKELMLAAGLMGLLISMRLGAPDKDDDPHLKGGYRWALRGLDKLTDELTFMYTPSSFTNILNGSVFPAVGILVEAERFFVTVIKKLFYSITGNEQAAAQQKPSKYVFRMLPITKEVIQYLAIFNNDIAKEYGIRMNTNYGSVR